MTLFGHDAHVAQFRAAMAGDRMHHAWLITGPRGVGKGSFAAMAAARLLADASGIPAPNDNFLIPYDHPTARLITAGSHPDFRRLERLANEKTGALARNITVDQVRGLRGLFATGTSMGDRRVILVDAIDDMERGAANALLKNLEEPPAGTIFLLISHAPGRLLPTIRSRCCVLAMSALDDVAMTSLLCHHRPDLNAQVRQTLIASARGSAAQALANGALDMASVDDALAELARTGDPTNVIRARLAQSLALKAAQPRYEAFLARVPTYIADQARRLGGRGLDTALRAWASARDLSAIAIPQSLIAESVVFEMAGYVAALAGDGAGAKA